jgi:predicted  nucleic acid-binding Zn-ribbon protein
MPMSVEYAFELQALRQKLASLRDGAPNIGDKHKIQKELDKIEPYLDEAGAVVIRATDADFQKVANQMKANLKPLDDAIKNINKLQEALTTAATVISAIVKAVGPVLGV